MQIDALFVGNKYHFTHYKSDLQEWNVRWFFKIGKMTASQFKWDSTLVQEIL